jgi:PrtD family type I secretion system ABC transporter
MVSRSELDAVGSTLRRSIFSIGLISLVANLLLLTGPLFMIAVYDHVIPTKNVDTLIGLIAIALAAYVLYGVVNVQRSRALTRVGASFAAAMSGRVFESVLRKPLLLGGQNDSVRLLRDIEDIRNYLAGPGASAMFDLPWAPIYLAICFGFHVWIGIAVTVGALLLAVLTIVTELMTRDASAEASSLSSRRNASVESSMRNIETLISMGALTGLMRRWNALTGLTIASSLSLSDRSSTFLEISRVFRMVLQSGVLAIGAYLVINGEASSGIIIASSILSSRALAPIDQLIGSWRSMLSARQGWHRLDALLRDVSPLRSGLPLPAPIRELAVEAVCLTPPGSSQQTLSEISFTVQSGSAVAVIGASGSGKSSLIRTLVGLWRPTRGAVRIDGSDVDSWSMDHRRRYIGYLAQEVELLEGTIALNIARFDESASADSIVAAALEAQVHDLILRLPKGYDTVVGPGATILSAGQKQRIALARALFGDPFFVVLDEPNSNLDSEGEAALSQAIMRVRQRAGIVILVAHRESVLGSCDYVLMMQNGELRRYGRREEVLRPHVARIEVGKPHFESSAAAVGSR